MGQEENKGAAADFRPSAEMVAAPAEGCRRCRPDAAIAVLWGELSLKEMAAGVDTFDYPAGSGLEGMKRGDCVNGPRPCPLVSCRFHLYLDVNPNTGSIKLNFPGLEVWDLKETCALDVADRGGVTLDEIGEIFNLTRERIRQIELQALHKLKRFKRGRELLVVNPAGLRRRQPRPILGSLRPFAPPAPPPAVSPAALGRAVPKRIAKVIPIRPPAADGAAMVVTAAKDEGQPSAPPPAPWKPRKDKPSQPAVASDPRRAYIKLIF